MTRTVTPRNYSRQAKIVRRAIHVAIAGIHGIVITNAGNMAGMSAGIAVLEHSKSELLVQA